MQNEEIFELCLNILIEYYKIYGHVTSNVEWGKRKLFGRRDKFKI